MSPEYRKMIFHVDMDAFFASVEELANPAIRGKPLVVAGSGKRSIITTASYPARACGIRTGMTVGQALARCPRVIVVRSDYGKYSEASAAVMRILESFSPLVQVTSVDEAFMDIRCPPSASTQALGIGRAIKDRVREGTGLACTVGIAGTRILAKLVGGLNKPDGLFLLEPGSEDDLLEETPVEKLCGIGPVTAGALHSMGIRTCGQLGRHPVDLLRGRFGSFGTRLSEMGRGRDTNGTGVDGPGTNRIKSIGHSVTLPCDLRDRTSMAPIILTLSEMVGRRARRYACRGSTLTLTWRYNDFSTRSRRLAASSPISLTREIYLRSMEILNTITLERPVRLLGISLENLSFGMYTPELLPEKIRSNDIQRAMDRINDRFGEFTLSFADAVPEVGGHRIISPAWRPGSEKNGH